MTSSPTTTRMPPISAGSSCTTTFSLRAKRFSSVATTSASCVASMGNALKTVASETPRSCVGESVKLLSDFRHHGETTVVDDRAKQVLHRLGQRRLHDRRDQIEHLFGADLGAVREFTQLRVAGYCRQRIDLLRKRSHVTLRSDVEQGFGIGPGQSSKFGHGSAPRRAAAAAHSSTFRRFNKSA